MKVSVKKISNIVSKNSLLENMDDDTPIQSLTDYSLQVLELCRLLWGPIEIPANCPSINQEYFEEQKRRQMLSAWLHQCVLSQPQQQVSLKLIRIFILRVFLCCLAMDNAEL